MPRVDGIIAWRHADGLVHQIGGYHDVLMQRTIFARCLVTLREYNYDLAMGQQVTRLQSNTEDPVSCLHCMVTP